MPFIFPHTISFHVRLSHLFVAHSEYSQGKVEYKARSILATLYSMRDIDLFSLVSRETSQQAVPASSFKRRCVEAFGAKLYYFCPAPRGSSGQKLFVLLHVWVRSKCFVGKFVHYVLVKYNQNVRVVSLRLRQSCSLQLEFMPMQNAKH